MKNDAVGIEQCHPVDYPMLLPDFGGFNISEVVTHLKPR